MNNLILNLCFNRLGTGPHELGNGHRGLGNGPHGLGNGHCGLGNGPHGEVFSA